MSNQKQPINDLLAHNLSIQNEINEAITKVLKSGWYVLGPEVEAFESEFANYIQTDYCLGVANGTDALELALKGLDIKQGDEVITAPNAAMYATTGILAIGATPVFADIDPNTFTISPESVEQMITPKTQAILVTHLYGKMAEIQKLQQLSKKHKIPIVEDCAQAHGAELHGKKAGSWGEVAAFSFYPTKNLGALGDGGAITTSSPDIADKIRKLRQYGWESKYINMLPGGRNSRLDEVQAAILRVKLKHLENWTKKRKSIADTYNQHLTHPSIQTPKFSDNDYVAHLYVIKTDEREKLQDYLISKGISAEVHYPLLDYQQPILKEIYINTHLPNSENVVKKILTLPCYPELPLAIVQNICYCINAWETECIRS